MTSHEASSVVPDNLDFVFIDGDHSYKAVLLDLNDWVPKIRSGGLLIGHDWTSTRRGVPQAGTEYLSQNENLFEPLYAKVDLDALKQVELSYKIGGQGVVHKERHTGWPMWWRIKK